MPLDCLEVSTGSPEQLVPEHAGPLRRRWQNICRFAVENTACFQTLENALLREMDWSREFCLLALEEYKRFMLLASFNPGETVPSVEVDTVWHMHILHTRLYELFCHEALEREFMHHDPSSGSEEEEIELKKLYKKTLERYAEIFGCPARQIWGEVPPETQTGKEIT